MLDIICFTKKGQNEKTRNILSCTVNVNENSLEQGLVCFAVASLELASKSWHPLLCRDALHQGERIFRRLPSIFWLAQLYHLKIEYAYRTDHYEKALLFLETAF